MASSLRADLRKPSLPHVSDWRSRVRIDIQKSYHEKRYFLPYNFAPKADFEEPWHLAMWVPHSPNGPTVFLNRDSELLEEQIKYHQQKYPPFMAEEVQKIVLEVYGEVAACKVAHSNRLKKMVPKEKLESEYRNEAALTTSLMGLMAEEAVISYRLRALGKQRAQKANE